MSDMAIVAGTPVSIEVKGKKYEVSPLTLGDWANLEAYAEERFFADWRARLELNAQDAEIAKVIRTRLATISKPELMRDSAAYMDDATGTRRRFWYMLKHRHPDITEEQAGYMVGFAEFNMVSKRLLGIPDNPEEDANAEPRPTAD